MFRGTTTVDAEYRKYCNPRAEKTSGNDVMAAALDSAKLLCLAQTIDKHSVSTQAHLTRRMLSRAEQMRSSNQTDAMMRLMRSMQIGDEFDRYFTIPDARSTVSALQTKFRVTGNSGNNRWDKLYKRNGSVPDAP